MTRPFRYLRSSCFLPVLLLLVLSAGFPGTVRADDTGSKRRSYPLLTTGTPRQGILRPEREDGWYATYRFRIPAGLLGARLAVEGATADLDLYVQKDTPPDDYSQTDWYAESEFWNEELLMTALYGDGLAPGNYYVDVAYTLDAPARDEAGRRIEELPFTLSLEHRRAEPAAVLIPGRPARLTLDPRWGALAVVAVDVPSGSPALRIDVHDTDGDIDLLLSRDASTDFADALMVSESLLGHETLVWTGDDGRVEPGRYFVTVFDPFAYDRSVDLSLTASLEDRAPAALLRLPSLPREIGPGGVPTAAIVQIIAPSGTGTGCVVSTSGWVITNDHVVRKADGTLPETVVAAISLEPDRPPAELFRARVVRGSREPDLALLKIETGRYGQPLPRGYRFPAWTWGSSILPERGEELILLGYPSVGGSGSRPVLTMTRGILAGREVTPYGLVYMTDGLVTGGSSGGALTRGDGVLLALPSFTVDERAGQMTYALPLDLVPGEWRRLIR